MQSNMFSPLRTFFRLDKKYLEWSYIHFNVQKKFYAKKKIYLFKCGHIYVEVC